jgi:hypothetical protein
MAYQTGTATTYSTLLDTLITFATANGWVLSRDDRGTTGEVILKGTGLAGTDAIYVGVRRYANVPGDAYGWVLQGFTALTGAAWMVQPGAITGRLPCLPLWNDTIKYWMMVNARRIILVAQVSNIYVAMYLGYILPYSSPGQWPYPLVIGGSNITDDSYNVPRYSDNGGNMTVPFIPAGDDNASPLVVRLADGTWRRLWNHIGSITPPGAVGSSLYTTHGVWPYSESTFGSNNNGITFLRPNMAGDYSLLPLRLARTETPDLLGIFDGVRHVPGYNSSSEDTVTEGTDTWLVVQNVFRTGLQSFFAVKEA